VTAWIQTYTGRRFDLVEPRAEDVVVDDLVHALACVNRFTGHARRPYSVAEHSVRVAALVEPEHRRAALLHDATEAYCADLARPAKRLPELAGYRDLEARVWAAIAARFDLPLELPAAVKRADLVALDLERRALLGQEPHPWNLGVTAEERRAADAAWFHVPGPWEPGWPWYDARNYLRDELAREGIR